MVLVTFFCSTTWAQTIVPPKPDYHYFIKYPSNIITNNEDGEIDNFLFKLEMLERGKKGKVKILHIGDSHIQADIFSGRIRTLFSGEERIPMSGRGLVFPYTLAKTNNPYDYDITYTGKWVGCRHVQSTKNCHWGLAGIVASTADTAAKFTITLTDPIYAFNKIRLYYHLHNNNPLDICIEPTDSHVVITSEFTDPKNRYKEVTFSSAVGKATFKITNYQNAIDIQNIWLDNDQIGLQYSSIGVNGAEAEHYLRCPDLFMQVKDYAPDLIIVSLGTNEAYAYGYNDYNFFVNLSVLIQRVKAAAPQASVLLTTPGHHLRARKYQNPNILKSVNTVKNVSEQTGAALWDFYTVMGGNQSINKWYVAGLAKLDKLHLTHKGYQLQGTLLYYAIINCYNQYITDKYKGENK